MRKNAVKSGQVFLSLDAKMFSNLIIRSGPKKQSKLLSTKNSYLDLPTKLEFFVKVECRRRTN